MTYRLGWAFVQYISVKNKSSSCQPYDPTMNKRNLLNTIPSSYGIWMERVFHLRDEYFPIRFRVSFINVITDDIGILRCIYYKCYTLTYDDEINKRSKKTCAQYTFKTCSIFWYNYINITLLLLLFFTYNGNV